MTTSSSSSKTMHDNTDHNDKIPAQRPNHFSIVRSHSLITDAVLHNSYPGKGTPDDPYAVEFIENDPRNPMLFSKFKRWAITLVLGLATLAVSFNSSAYSGGVEQVIEQFQCTETVATLGISLFVLGFAIGPLFWGPMSELYGRQALFIGTYGALTVFNAGAAGSQNVATLMVLRFFAGAFGSSPLTNAAGVIADMFPAKERGLAMALFATTPFMGPCLGPIVGGFVGEDIGWRWLEGILAIFSGVVWFLGTAYVPETYAPVLLRARADALSKRTGKVYVSKLELTGAKTKPNPVQLFKTALSRPWILLFREPVVMITSIYLAIIYGTLYMCFAAFPIVYQEERGWSQGVGGLAFIGVAVGFMLAICYIIPDNGRYARIEEEAKAKGELFAPPEARLPPALIGSVLLPVGLFWFAWTNYPEFSWAPSVVAGIPFGAGMVLVFLSIFNYLVDTYTIYAASVLAANSVLRSLFGFAFPLFASYMYENLGIHWASSIPAFLALACVPAPFLFYKYGTRIRRGQKYSREAEDMMRKVLSAEHEDGSEEEKSSTEEEVSGNAKGPEKGKDVEENRGRERKGKDMETSLGHRREKGEAAETKIQPQKVIKSRASLIGADEDVDIEKGLVN